MEYMTPKEAAKRWEISERRVQALCSAGKIKNVKRFGNVWAIPLNMLKPKDGRYKKNPDKTS